MPTTARGLPYPAASDAPNGPAQIAALAQAIDDQLGYDPNYSPTMTSSGTNPNLGTGQTRDAVYDDSFGWITMSFFMQFGTSPSAGTGQYRISLPIPAANFLGTGLPQACGAGLIRDSSAGTTVQATWYLLGGDAYILGYAQDSSITATSPWNWAVGDWLAGTIRYRAAS